jgi:hypothetical protein
VRGAGSVFEHDVQIGTSATNRTLVVQGNYRGTVQRTATFTPPGSNRALTLVRIGNTVCVCDNWFVVANTQNANNEGHNTLIPNGFRPTHNVFLTIENHGTNSDSANMGAEVMNNGTFRYRTQIPGTNTSRWLIGTWLTLQE